MKHGNIYGIFLSALLFHGCGSSHTVSTKVLREGETNATFNENGTALFVADSLLAGEEQNDTGSLGKDCMTILFQKGHPHTRLQFDRRGIVSAIQIENRRNGSIRIFERNDVNTTFDFKSKTPYRYCLLYDSEFNKTKRPLFVRLESAPLGADDADVQTLKNGEDCPGCDLDNADLSNLDLSDLNLSRARMNQVLLYQTDLSGALLYGTHLSDISAAGSTFDRTDLRHVYSLSFANIEDAFFRSTKFPAYTDAPNAFSASISYKNIDFSHADLNDTNMATIKFDNCDFESAKFYNANLYYSSFHDDNMSRADFTGAKVNEKTDFTDADLRHLANNSLHVLEEGEAKLDNAIVADKGDGKYLVRYEDFGQIRFYDDKNCHGKRVLTLDSEKNWDINLKEGYKDKNDRIASVLFYPRTRKKIELLLYDDPQGRTKTNGGTEDYIRIDRGGKSIEKPFCIRGLEHSTSSREENEGFSVTYHKATFPNVAGLNNKVSHIKLRNK